MQHPSEIKYRNRSENEFGKVSVIKMSKKLVAYFSASGVTRVQLQNWQRPHRRIFTKYVRKFLTQRQI